ncbi:MAG: hypothetical protein WC998_03245 [Candidatus Paceibacterota bacterium]
MPALNKPNPVVNTTEKEITFEKGVINLPDDIRGKIRKLMTFEKVPTQEILVQRANDIVSCINDGLKILSREKKISFPDSEYDGEPANYGWDVIIDCPNFLQRRLEDVMMISAYRPAYILPGGGLLWLYDDESEWHHRRNALTPENVRLQDFLSGKITEDKIPSYPTL